MSVEEKTSRKSIVEADVVGYWQIPGRAQRRIVGKTDQEGKFATVMLVDTDTPEKCTLVITAIKKAGYIFPSMPVQRQWNGISPLMDGTGGNGDFSHDPRDESELHKRGYSAAKDVSVADRHRVLQRAVEDHDGLGLAYVVRWLTNFNRFNQNNETQIEATKRRKDDVRWLKTTYYDPLKVKHFHFPPI